MPRSKRAKSKPTNEQGIVRITVTLLHAKGNLSRKFYVIGRVSEVAEVIEKKLLRPAAHYTLRSIPKVSPFRTLRRNKVRK